MKFVDLHTHTNKSDGKLSPDALLKYAKEKDLVAIAITDHDSVEGIETAIAAGRKFGIEVISGIEISTTYRYKDADYEIHLVGLFIDYKSKDIISMCRAAKKSREGKFVKTIALLNSVIPELNADPMDADVLIAENHIMAKPHIAEELVARGICSSVPEAFDRYLNVYKPDRKKIYFSDAIDLIHKSKGIAILSHPTLSQSVGGITEDRAQQEDIFSDMKSLGLDGIEVRYWRTTDERENWLTSTAQKYDLLISGGSDFHKIKRNERAIDEDLGYLNIPKSWLDSMKKKVHR